MGNCCKTASSTQWGGEDWGSLISEKKSKKDNNRKRSSKKVFDLISASSSSLDDDHSNGRIKIKMTKREFEVLLGEMEKQKQKPKQKQKQQGKVISAEQVLVSLMKARENHQIHRPWSPVLESIPEV